MYNSIYGKNHYSYENYNKGKTPAYRRKNHTYDQLINELIERKENSDDLLEGKFATLPSSESSS